jgi:muconolactone delta-isomerase
MGMEVMSTRTIPVRSRQATRNQPTASGKETSSMKKIPWNRLGLYAVIPLFLYFGTDALHHWSLTSPYFSVKNVTVTGIGHLTLSVVKARLGLKSSDNLLAINLALFQTRIESHPWVQSASLSRDLPNTLLVEVVERRPSVAIIPLGGKASYLADDNGVILSDSATRLEKFAVLREITLKQKSQKLKIGQVLTGEQFQTGLAAVKLFRSQWPENRKEGVRLTAVHLKDFPTRQKISMGILGPQGQTTWLHLKPKKVNEGLKQLSALVRHWNRNPWPKEVDLSMGSRAVTR